MLNLLCAQLAMVPASAQKTENGQHDDRIYMYEVRKLNNFNIVGNQNWVNNKVESLCG